MSELSNSNIFFKHNDICYHADISLDSLTTHPPPGAVVVSSISSFFQNCEDCCDSLVQPIASSCPYSSDVSPFQISGYYDGFFSASSCGTCNNSALPAWNGNFDTIVPPAYCQFLAGSGGSIDGKEFIGGAATSISLYVGVRWYMRISCSSGFPTTVWEGEKTVGESPVGTYTRIGGCSASPSTLEVV